LPAQEVISPPAGGGASGATTDGSSAGSGETGEGTTGTQYALPKWEREDVQPKSARTGQVYGLEAFRGKTIVVTLFEGFCTFCKSNSLLAEELQNELAAEGLDVVSAILADPNASEFASRVSFPIFRDADGSAWKEMRPQAIKHDTFVFGPDGKRTFFLAGSSQGDPANWKTTVGSAVREVAKNTGSEG
jgi:hypothetical protein